MPLQLRFAALLEMSQEELEQEVERELAENPALDRKLEPGDERRYYSPLSPRPDFEPVQASAAPSLAEHLAEQLRDLPAELSPLLPLVNYMIGALDSNGYLTRSLPQLRDDMALDASLDLNPTIEQVRQAATILQSLEPPGVGASDLRQTLLLQILRLKPSEPQEDALEIVKYYFDLFAKRNFRELEEESEMSRERIDRAGALIASLNPKPGAEFASTTEVTAVTPDFLVETDNDIVTLTMPNSLPQLQIEESFNVDVAGDEGRFIADRRERARDFIGLLERRQNTLLSIGRAIVKHQSGFFTHGDDEAALRPMVLRDIASLTGIEPSAISRAMSGKWLSTPYGLYPLKFFFSHRRHASDSLSTPAILQALREVVEAEDPASPLTDEQIAAALTARGLPTARRTVSKYRARLNLPSASLRRR